jgi:hypothetical protein
MKIIRLLIILATVALVGYSLSLRVPVNRLDGGDPADHACGDFNEAATVDRLIKLDGKLYDRASSAGSSADLKDCPT